MQEPVYGTWLRKHHSPGVGIGLLIWINHRASKINQASLTIRLQVGQGLSDDGDRERGAEKKLIMLVRAAPVTWVRQPP